MVKKAQGKPAGAFVLLEDGTMVEGVVPEDLVFVAHNCKSYNKIAKRFANRAKARWDEDGEDISSISLPDADRVGYVSDGGRLVLEDPSLFFSTAALGSEEQSSDTHKLVPAEEYAAKIGKTAEAVRHAAREGLLAAVKKGNGRWYVWSDAAYPEDKRVSKAKELPGFIKDLVNATSEEAVERALARVREELKQKEGTAAERANALANALSLTVAQRDAIGTKINELQNVRARYLFRSHRFEDCSLNTVQLKAWGYIFASLACTNKNSSEVAEFAAAYGTYEGEALTPEIANAICESIGKDAALCSQGIRKCIGVGAFGFSFDSVSQAFCSSRPQKS